MLAVDSIFMMPQLGILATVHPKAAMHVFDKDCLVKLGTTIAPLGPSSSNLKFGEPCVTVTIEYNEQVIEESVPYGSMKVIKIPEETTVDAVIRPERHFDAGNGYGRVVETQVHGGVVGVIIDCRGRPTVLPEDPVLRNQKLVEWFKAMDMYPADLLDKYAAQGV